MSLRNYFKKSDSDESKTKLGLLDMGEYFWFNDRIYRKMYLTTDLDIYGITLTEKVKKFSFNALVKPLSINAHHRENGYVTCRLGDLDAGSYFQYSRGLYQFIETKGNKKVLAFDGSSTDITNFDQFIKVRLVKPRVELSLKQLRRIFSTPDVVDIVY